jgi:predicted RNA-binding Zn-ribbon protein involved in translation (DUF1610 family)
MGNDGLALGGDSLLSAKRTVPTACAALRRTPHSIFNRYADLSRLVGSPLGIQSLVSPQRQPPIFGVCGHCRLDCLYSLFCLLCCHSAEPSRAIGDLIVSHMVKNHHLAKSISDAAWGDFRRWVEYFGKVFGVATVAVPPYYTSQNCSHCGEVVKKSLSTRTHICPHCGHVQDRDHNAAINIRQKGLKYGGTHRNQSLGRERPLSAVKQLTQTSWLREPRIPVALALGSVKKLLHCLGILKHARPI